VSRHQSAALTALSPSSACCVAISLGLRAAWDLIARQQGRQQGSYGRADWPRCPATIRPGSMHCVVNQAHCGVKQGCCGGKGLNPQGIVSCRCLRSFRCWGGLCSCRCLGCQCACDACFFVLLLRGYMMQLLLWDIHYACELARSVMYMLRTVKRVCVACGKSFLCTQQHHVGICSFVHQCFLDCPRPEWTERRSPLQ
jgi:hypothetical protein